MSNGVIIPVDYEGEWIDTNITGLKYKKVNNLVMVYFDSVAIQAATITAITGLPVPIGSSSGSRFGVPVTGVDLITNQGYISYNIATYGWAIYSPNGMTARGNIIYLTNE